jgi:hypothetical protein
VDICIKLLESWFERKKEIVFPPKLLTGDEIMKLLNMKPGPDLGKVILALQEAQGAGEVLTVEDAVNYIRGWFDQQVEGESYGDISSN